MSIILDGTTGITTPGLTNTGTETILNLTTTGNTILGDATTDTLNVGAGGLVKDASGNVGIGTASPSYKLDVAGSAGVGIRYKSSGSYGAFLADNTSSTGGGYFTAYQNGSQKALFGVSGAYEGNTSSDAMVAADATGGAIRFYTNGSASAKATLDSSGNLGIGTSSPASKLEVRNGAVTAGATAIVLNGRYDDSYPTSGAGYFQLRTNNADTTSGGLSVYTNNAGTLRLSYIAAETGSGNSYHAWNTNGTERMRIDSSGNVGIGLSSYTGKLAVNGVIATYASTDNNYRGSMDVESGNLRLIAPPYASNPTNITFCTGTSSTERMRIDSSGNVGIGTSSPSGKLHVSGGAAIVNQNKMGVGASCYSISTFVGSRTITLSSTHGEYKATLTTVGIAPYAGSGWFCNTTVFCGFFNDASGYITTISNTTSGPGASYMTFANPTNPSAGTVTQVVTISGAAGNYRFSSYVETLQANDVTISISGTNN